MNLARRGVEVTLLDSSLAMLEIAERTARKAEVGDKVVLQHGDAAQAGKLFDGSCSTSFSATMCSSTSTVQVR